MPVFCLAFAKVNLLLRVLQKRRDGYHEIETVMQTMSLADDLLFEPLKEGPIEVRCEGYGVPGGEGNLVYKALLALKDATGAGWGMRVRVRKNIPPRSGLGGGSSDAACAISVASALWGLDLTVPELEAVAAKVGADVPFFIRGGTQVCTGRGEHVQPAHPLARSTWLVVKPPWDFLTKEVYARYRYSLTDVGPPASMLLGELAKRGLDGLSRLVHNGLERAAEELYPGNREVRSVLERAGVRCVAMSGSGSAWFGLLPGEDAWTRVSAACKEAGWKAFRVRPVRTGWVRRGHVPGAGHV